MPTKVAVPLGHPLTAPIAEFLTDLANANRSAHTVRCYRGDLAGFAATHPGGVTTIDAAALRRFLATLSTQAPATRARKQAALASFLTWCCRQDLLPADPMAKLERISVPERVPRGVRLSGIGVDRSERAMVGSHSTLNLRDDVKVTSRR